MDKKGDAYTDHSLCGHRHPWGLGSPHWLVGHHKHLLTRYSENVFQRNIASKTPSKPWTITWPGPAPTIGALLAIGGAGPGVGGAVEGGACHRVSHITHILFEDQPVGSCSRSAADFEQLPFEDRVLKIHTATCTPRCCPAAPSSTSTLARPTSPAGS